ncbi:hypothetical protein OHC33_002743 [Knufia fluminis]|uniref:Uncharacterized protein n=1 Tax=Knufia fluminis TaxID=191047 RepID=A0AAN8EKY0_9EURO|nr:hypothetical protein OHC33_002743 [Knufia fluminis]
MPLLPSPLPLRLRHYQQSLQIWAESLMDSGMGESVAESWVASPPIWLSTVLNNTEVSDLESSAGDPLFLTFKKIDSPWDKGGEQDKHGKQHWCHKWKKICKASGWIWPYPMFKCFKVVHECVSN